MCGRFASYKHHEKLNKIFDLKNKAENQFKSYNVTPGQNINIILNKCINRESVIKQKNFFLQLSILENQIIPNIKMKSTIIVTLSV